MPTPFFTFAIVRKRDLLAVRQKARQLAHLLHYSPREEACIAAGTFAVAEQAWQAPAPVEIAFVLESDHLLIFPRIKKSANLNTSAVADMERHFLKLKKPLPQSPADLELDDLGWMLGQTEASLSLFEEVSRQNQELLMLLHELHAATGKDGTSEREWHNPSAA